MRNAGSFLRFQPRLQPSRAMLYLSPALAVVATLVLSLIHI